MLVIPLPLKKITQKAYFHEVFTWTEAEAALSAGVFHREKVFIQAVRSSLKDKVEIQP